MPHSPTARIARIARIRRTTGARLAFATAAVVAAAVAAAEGTAPAPAEAQGGVQTVPAARAPTRPGPPPPAAQVIFDTDMGNDIDDALALAMLHALESRGEVRLLAVTVTKDEPYAAPYVDLLNTFYGRPDVPVGVVRGGVTPHPDYPRVVATMTDAAGVLVYPHDLRSGSAAPEATALLRQVLAAQPDSSVVIVQVGFSTNLARLLATPGDRHSPLDGRALVARKVRRLAVMAGFFGRGRPGGRDFVEYNVERDVASARTLFAEWPGAIDVSGFEVGETILYPAVSIARDFRYAARHPVRDAYLAYTGGRWPYDRPTWDLTSVLQAVRPDRGYFTLSAPGRVVLDARGRTTFHPDRAGRHRYLRASPAQAAQAREAMIQLASQPPERPPERVPTP